MTFEEKIKKFNSLIQESKKIVFCGGIIRPNVVLYGESLPSSAWNEAYSDLAEADLIIVGGTSLSCRSSY